MSRSNVRNPIPEGGSSRVWMLRAASSSPLFGVKLSKSGWVCEILPLSSWSLGTAGLGIIDAEIHSHSPHSTVLPLRVLCSQSIPTSFSPCHPFPPKLGTSRDQNPRNYPQQFPIFSRKPRPFLQHPHLNLWSEENRFSSPVSLNSLHFSYPALTGTFYPPSLFFQSWIS